MAVKHPLPNKKARSTGWLLLLGILLPLLWYGGSIGFLDNEEQRLWERVRRAERFLHQWRREQGCGASEEADPWKLGLIGYEWSPLTTTLGSLPAKRTACHPSWAVSSLEWFDRLQLAEGDRIAILSSSSFPGLLLNLLAAAESRNLEILLILSLGASTWGANVPECPWPTLAETLRRQGLLHTKAQWLTPGGGGEHGGGVPPEGMALMRETARLTDIPLIVGDDLQSVIRWKMERLATFRPDLVVSIGGSHANMGSDEAVLQLPGGLLRPEMQDNAGNGVIGKALGEGVPVLHLLNLEGLARKRGIPCNAPPAPFHIDRRSMMLFLPGIALFFTILLRHRRWEKV
ncbi:MAG: poly-gamma-glutamate system protein [Synergistales bacterium]|nr:poly-gamma-glutamate system protein [Synergistales bacterium]